MDKKLETAARAYHALPQPGKMEVRPTKSRNTQQDLTLAYSPSVAVPCKDIETDPELIYNYTAKGNLAAVVSNGTVVLGLGNIGAMAGKPVMEGKGLLFKIYAGIDVFDLEVDEKDLKKFVEIVRSLVPTLGGINLEDTKAPECFEIEEESRTVLDISVMHDDQYDTATISAAGMLNAFKIAGKKIEKVQIVVSGVGASAQSCARLYIVPGARRENIVMIGSKGVIHTDRPNLDERKAFFATGCEGIYTLADAVQGADLLLGLSQPDVLTPEMVQKMTPNPIVSALANPEPEVEHEGAKVVCPDVLMATGRSDYPNQINNMIGFLYIFRGAFDVRAMAINEEMEMAATMAIAGPTQEPVPDEVSSAHGHMPLHFGPDHFIPKPVDPHLITRVSMAVTQAAIRTGVARRGVTDWEAYEQSLIIRTRGASHLLRCIHEAVQMSPKRMVYAAGENPLVLCTTTEVSHLGIARPIVLGDPEVTRQIVKKHNIDLSIIEVTNQHDGQWKAKREKYAQRYTEQSWRKGGVLSEAKDKMLGPNYFGMMMVQCGDADSLITGVYSNYVYLPNVTHDTIGIAPGHQYFATVHLVVMKSGPLFLADAPINQNLKAETLVDITLLAAEKVRCFGIKPVIAMVSFSNFGSADAESSVETRKAVETLHREHPHIMVDGEMRLQTAFNYRRRGEEFPNNRIRGEPANVLIFPRLPAANARYQLLKHLDIAEDMIGPIQIGLAKPIYFADHDADVKDIVNITAMASLDSNSCFVQSVAPQYDKGGDLPSWWVFLFSFIGGEYKKEDT